MRIMVVGSLLGLGKSIGKMLLPGLKNKAMKKMGIPSPRPSRGKKILKTLAIGTPLTIGAIVGGKYLLDRKTV